MRGNLKAKSLLWCCRILDECPCVVAAACCVSPVQHVVFLCLQNLFGHSLLINHLTLIWPKIAVSLNRVKAICAFCTLFLHAISIFCPTAHHYQFINVFYPGSPPTVSTAAI